jgi:hypothetical protein
VELGGLPDRADRELGGCRVSGHVRR